MNVKKIGFFTFAFSPGAVSGGGNLDRGLFYNYFNLQFPPQPHTCSTHRPYSKISFLTLISPSSLSPYLALPLPHPKIQIRIPNPHPFQSKNNAISLQITTSIYQAKNKSKPQHNKKHSQIDPNHSTC